MKTTFSTLLSALLCIAMVLSFAACGEETPAATTTDNDTAVTTTTAAPVDEEEPSIVGDWETSIDLGAVLAQAFSAQGADVDAGSLVMTVTYSFNEDNTLNIAVDEEAVKAQIPGVLDAIAASNEEFYNTMMAEYESEEDAVDGFMEGFVSGMVSSFDAIGEMTYEFDGSNLTMNIAGTSTTVEVELTATSLTFEENGVVTTLTKV